jgi:UDP-N-acetylglucosamine 3-dehydrogenase
MGEAATQAAFLPLRAAVIGLGAIGRHHCRVYEELPGVELVAVADVREAAVAQATAGGRSRGYTNAAALLKCERLDLVSIAVPTSRHHDVAMLAIERRVHVLVEKPIASTIEQARGMIDAAATAGIRLMVGHVERFNPAIIELNRRLDQAGPLLQVKARRVGPSPDRAHDMGVLMDLGTHDIDVMRVLLRGALVEQLYAETARRMDAEHEDMGLGVIRFAGGVVGLVDVNRLAPSKVRELTVVGSHGTFVANYLTQDLIFWEHAAVPTDWNSAVDPRLLGLSQGVPTRIPCVRGEPLRAELAAFCRYVREGGACPAPPEEAAETLAIALALVDSALSGRSVDGRRPVDEVRIGQGLAWRGFSAD